MMAEKEQYCLVCGMSILQANICPACGSAQNTSHDAEEPPISTGLVELLFGINQAPKYQSEDSKLYGMEFAPPSIES